MNVLNRPNMTQYKVFKDDADDIEAVNTDKTKTVSTYQYKLRTRMQTVIHQTLRTFLHERINIEEARTIITLYRYNEMRECEDIQVMWEEVTGFETSFSNSYQAYY